MSRTDGTVTPLLIFFCVDMLEVVLNSGSNISLIHRLCGLITIECHWEILKQGHCLNEKMNYSDFSLLSFCVCTDEVTVFVLIDCHQLFLTAWLALKCCENLTL